MRPGSGLVLAAAKVRRVTLLQATHFVNLDRSVHGRAQLLKELLDFLGQ